MQRPQTVMGAYIRSFDHQILKGMISLKVLPVEEFKKLEKLEYFPLPYNKDQKTVLVLEKQSTDADKLLLFMREAVDNFVRRLQESKLLGVRGSIENLKQCKIR